MKHRGLLFGRHGLREDPAGMTVFWTVHGWRYCGLVCRSPAYRSGSRSMIMLRLRSASRRRPAPHEARWVAYEPCPGITEVSASAVEVITSQDAFETEEGSIRPYRVREVRP